MVYIDPQRKRDRERQRERYECRETQNHRRESSMFKTLMICETEFVDEKVYAL